MGAMVVTTMALFMNCSPLAKKQNLNANRTKQKTTQSAIGSDQTNGPEDLPELAVASAL